MVGPGQFPAELLAADPDSALNRLLVGHDWSTSPLGPPQEWPPTLRTAVSLCLNSRFPMLIWWGPELAMLYNDAYAPILGTKHPASLGSPGARVWSDIWPVIGDMLDGVLRRGEATYDEDLLLVMRRHGFDEEAYFTFSYSPLVQPDGVVGGVFTAVTETTERVLGARRLAALQRIGDVPAARIADVDGVCEVIAGVLAEHRADLPFGLVYLREGDSDDARLAAAFGLDAARMPAAVPGDAPAPVLPEPPTDGLADAVRKVLGTGRAATVTGLAGRLPGLTHAGSSRVGDADVNRAVALPLVAAGADRPVGVLVVGLSPFLPVDDDYRGFLVLVAGRVVSALTDAEAAQAQRRRADELAELDRAKTEFFTGVSHELRTPLALIAGPTEDSLNDGAEPLPPVHRERLELVRRSTGRLRRLVDTLLDFARIEDARLDPEPVAVDAGELSRGIAESFAPAVTRAGLELTVDCPAGGPALLLDPDVWERILLNLLSNAVKYTPAGTVHIAVHRHDDVLTAAVSDTGIGIPAAEQPLLFQRFHRVRDAGGRSHEGSGIGLALVAELVRLHGGTVDVQSAPGEGSTFTVTIPALDAGGPAVPSAPRAVDRYRDEALQWTAPAPDDAEDAGDERDATLLIAEDNPDLRGYLRTLLEPHYRVVATADGEAALLEARRRPPDLVLADVMMPRRDGFGLLGALRADPGTAAVPVILLSARAGEEAAIEGLAAGADDYLVKPFASAELLARVRAHLELARARAEDSRRLQDLAQATVDINGARTTAQALDVLADSARQLIGAHRAVAGLTAPDGRSAPVRAESVSPGRAAGREPGGSPGHGVLSAQLTAADGVDLGFVQLTDRVRGEFTADDKAVLTQLAGVASAVVEKGQLLQRQTEVALTLQRSILGPTQLPRGFAVRYEPAAGSLEVGGDWYDVVSLPDDGVGIVVGDVVGRGLLAAAVMGQLRSAARALLLEHHTPAEVLTALDTFAALTPGARCSTVFCAVIEPGAATMSYSGAGHPPAILVGPAGDHHLLADAGSVPLAVLEGIERPQATVDLVEGATLLLYTDGLVERRRESIDEGIGRAVAAVAGGRDLDPDEQVERLAGRLLGDGHDDDVAYLLYRHRYRHEPLRLDLPSRPAGLAGLRRSLHAWLDGAGVAADPADDLVLIACEAVSNAIEHGYGLAGDRVVRITAATDGERVHLTVRDSGTWRAPSADPGFRGRGMPVMAALADSFSIDRTAAGTAVHLSRRITG